MVAELGHLQEQREPEEQKYTWMWTLAAIQILLPGF